METAPGPVLAGPGNGALTVNTRHAQKSLQAPRFWESIGLLWHSCIQADSEFPAMGTVLADLGKTSVPLSSSCPSWQEAAQTEGEGSCPAWKATGGWWWGCRWGGHREVEDGHSSRRMSKEDGKERDLRC